MPLFGELNDSLFLRDIIFSEFVSYRVDVSDRTDVLTNAEKVRKEVGDVTILVNNAGILPCRPLKDHSPELIQKVFQVNVFAHFWVRSIYFLSYNLFFIISINPVVCI